jgi:hypothetical protein
MATSTMCVSQQNVPTTGMQTSLRLHSNSGSSPRQLDDGDGVFISAGLLHGQRAL